MKTKLQFQKPALKPIIFALLAFYLGNSSFLKIYKLDKSFSLDVSQSQHQKEQLFVRVIPDVDNVKNS